MVQSKCMQSSPWRHACNSWIISVMLASTTVMGISEWRVSFHIVAGMSIEVGILLYDFATNPWFSNSVMRGNS
jgi:hypothetical protein